MENNKSTIEILKITLVVENIGGLGAKTTTKEGKEGARFAGKLKCPKFNKINRKVQGDKTNFENSLGCWKCCWFWGENKKENGELGEKFAWKFMCPELCQMQRKVKSSNIDYDN